MSGKWSKKQTYEKVQYVISISIVIVIFTQILGVWKTGEKIVMPLMCLLLLIEIIADWKKNKKISKYSLCAVILTLVASILNFVTK